MDTILPIEKDLLALFADDVAVSFSFACPEQAPLHKAEEAHTGQMVPKRLREFMHGRHCARVALSRLGAEPGAIGKAKDRAPVWPTGIVGSISHASDIAAAVVAYSTQFRGLGLDVESSAPLDGDLVNMILRAEERDSIEPAKAKLVFSIKEAIYKCIYPTVACYVDFHQMAVQLNTVDKSFTAMPKNVTWNPDKIKGLSGRYMELEDFVVSAAWIRAA